MTFGIVTALLSLIIVDYFWSTIPNMKCVQIQTIVSQGHSGKFSQDSDVLWIQIQFLVIF